MNKKNLAVGAGFLSIGSEDAIFLPNTLNGCGILNRHDQIVAINQPGSETSLGVFGDSCLTFNSFMP